jgi:NAD(P)H-nitrite reductase large subunit
MKIVIIGNSAAGLSGLEAFRKQDQSSLVTLIAKEDQRPYSKVLLPYYLRGKVPYDHLFIRDKDYFNRLKVSCVKGSVVKLLVDQQCVQLDDGTLLPYDKLLIASGSSPVKPPIPGLSGEGIHHLWTLEDVRQLKTHFIKGKHVVVLGSGFVSLQGACAALSQGLTVSVIELVERIMMRALDEQGADILAAQMKSKGVDLRVNTLTTRIEKTEEQRYLLHFKDGGHLESDFIIVGTGVRPNIDFLEGTAIKVDAGILVNEQMESSQPGIYAAGDVAQVPSFTGGKPVVHALWPTAVETGTIAGACMASGKNRYKGSLNMNVTQMFDLTVASMGEFVGDDACESWIDESLPDQQYLKIVLKDGVPIGATCVGSADLVATLGMLRPLIREKVRLSGEPEMLKSIMAQNISQHHQAFVK